MSIAVATSLAHSIEPGEPFFRITVGNSVSHSLFSISRIRSGNRDFPLPIAHGVLQFCPMLRSVSLMIVLFVIGTTGGVFAQSKNDEQHPHFADLSPQDTVRLEQQREVIAKAAKKHYGTPSLTRTKADLPVLQKLIDDKVFAKSQTYELQCLGVVFGDVLTSDLPLRWVMITDEFGTDPTLRFKKTDANINALTMISKRVERDQPVDLSDMLHWTRQQLSKLENER